MKKTLAAALISIPLMGCAAKNIAMEPQKNIEDICASESLALSMSCVQSFVKSVYNYRITDDAFTLTRNAQDVINNGGDCFDYAMLWGAIASEMGYNAKLNFFNQKEGPWAHVFTTIWKEDMSEYCIADQTKLTCSALGVPDEVPEDMYRGE